MSRRLSFVVLVIVGQSLNAESPQAHSTRDTARTSVLFAGRKAGSHKAWTAADGSRNFYFGFNDRGRGPALSERVVLGSDGLPVRIDITGLMPFTRLTV